MATTPRRQHRRTAAPEPGHVALRAEVLAGLREHPRKLPPKLFYDATGAMLFERITTLEEYYPTRSELAILARHARDIAALAGPDVALIEYGSGAGRKVRLLLDALVRPMAYIPIDISGEQLREVGETLRAEYPDVAIHPVRADYTRPITLPKVPGESRHVAFFPGSTIGNFEPDAAARFLRGVRQTVGDDGALVLGVDRVKDPARLESAYNDASGVTAAFNRNMLVRLNRELGSDFQVDRFAHRAVWNGDHSRIEMHLVADGPQDVHLAGERFHFKAGEGIWTESSYKYDREMLDQLVGGAGFRTTAIWSDADDNFWVAFLDAA